MKNCKEQVELNPKANGGESAIALITFKERELSLNISLACYGHHTSDFFVNFSNPDDMVKFGEALIKIANHAKIQAVKDHYSSAT